MIFEAVKNLMKIYDNNINILISGKEQDPCSRQDEQKDQSTRYLGKSNSSPWNEWFRSRQVQEKFTS